MQQKELYQRLQALEQQKQNIENEIYHLKQVIEKLSPFTKTQKIQLFKSLFIVRDDVYATHWISKDGNKKGYAPATYTFRGSVVLVKDWERIKRWSIELKMKISCFDNEATIIEELLSVEGKAQDIGGYDNPNEELAEKAMRPSATLNGIIDAI